MAAAHPTTFSTDIVIQKLKPRAERYEHFDTKPWELHLRITKRGTKALVGYYRDDVKLKRLTLGQCGNGDGQLPLAKARKRVTELCNNLTPGV